MNKVPETMMSVTELAAFLAVQPSWVYAQTARKAIPHTRVGRYVRFWLPDVMSWLATSAS